MPAIPTYQERVSNRVGTVGQSVTPGQGVAAIGQALQGIAGVAREVREQERSLKLSQLTTWATLQMEQFVAGLAEDSDFDTQPDRFDAFAKELEKQAQEAAGSDTSLYQAWKQQVTPLTLKKSIDVRQAATKGLVQRTRAGIQDELQAMLEIVVADPAHDEMLINRGLLLINDAEQRRVYDPEEAQKLRARFTDDVAAARVRWDIQQDPDAAEMKLLSGEYPGLSSERRAIWLERAVAASDSRIRREQAEEERAYRLAERARKEAASAAQKEGDKLLADGRLDPDWIEQNRDRLDPGDYRYFYKALTSEGGGITDRDLYAQLRLRAVSEDIREEARKALIDGKLQPSDFDRLSGIVEQSLVEKSLPNFYKRGEDYIRQALRTSDVNWDPAAEQRLAEALDDWHEWARSNPQATQEQARQAYRNFVVDYQMIDLRNNPLIERRPRFLVGDRSRPDLESTAAETLAAYQRGEITQQQFEEQARIISAWQEMIEKMGAN